MNVRLIIMLATALGLAFFAVSIAKTLMQDKSVTQKTVPVVVAAVDIPLGINIENQHLKIIEWLGTTSPAGTYATKEQLINKITKNNFYQDELITEKRLSENSTGSKLSSVIKKDYRAISVRVDDVVGVAGFISPTNNVDVLATKLDKAMNQAVTRTLLQNIKVLAVDQDIVKDKPGVVRSVTLELQPEQAESIVQALQEGTIQLSLRNPIDNELLVATKKTETFNVAQVEKKLEKKHVLRVIPW